ncbi:hypothetical protein [Actinoplanes sp. GCM10030250]|uniref:hypothetical protein n=1 Tax=Actinoplanes sp. GCM10030250 TaxID=3273376 RepID=UPI00360A02B7
MRKILRRIRRAGSATWSTRAARRAPLGGMRRLIAVVTAGVLLVAPMPALASASGPVDWDVNKFHSGLFAAYMRAHNPGVQGLKNLVLTAVIMDYRQTHPNATQDELRTNLALARAKVDAAGNADNFSRTAYGYTVKFLDAISGIPWVSIATPMVKGLLDVTVGGKTAARAALDDSLTASVRNYRFMQETYTLQEEVWGGFMRMAATDDDLAATWDGDIGAQVNVRAQATVEQLLADPLLGTFINTEAILEHLGNSQAYMAALKAELSGALDKLSEQNAETQRMLTAANLKYPVGPGPKPTPEDYTRELGAAADRQVAIDAANSAFYILSTLAGFVDKRAGEDFQALGKAAVGIATAINQYLPTVAGLGLAEALGSLSTVVLTGNILGAVMTLAPLFLGSGPSETELIRQEITKLREDVQNLRTEMHDRFDRVESMLDAIYDDVMSVLDKMCGDLVIIKGEIEAIKQQLARIETKVDALSLSMQQALRADGLRDTAVVLNTYVGYTARTGRTLSVEQFDHAEGTLFTTGETTASDAPFVYTRPEWSQGGLRPAQVLDQKGVYGSMDYLAYLARTWDPAFPSTYELSHPGVWTMAARGFNALAVENPALARSPAGSERFSTKLIKSGEAINAAANRFSRPTSDGHRNALFTGLTESYKQAVNAQSAELRRLRDAVTGGGYNPWYEANQLPPTRIAEKAQMGNCSGFGLTVAVPANARFAGVANTYHLADHGLKGGFKPEYRICYDAAFVDHVTRTGPRQETTTANLLLTVHLQTRFPNDQWRDVRVFTNKKSAGIICSWTTRDPIPQGYCHDEAYVMRYDYPTAHKPAFEAGASFTDDNTTLAVNRAKVDRMLWGKQKEYYQRVKAAFADVTSPLAARSADIVEAFKLLQAYTELGFPVAQEQDGQLSGYLNGVNMLPSDYRIAGAPVGADLPDTNISRAYTVAVTNFAPCTQAAAGDPCPDGVTMMDPRKNQAPIFSPICSGADSPNSPNEFLGNCIHAVAIERAGELGGLYEKYSQRLAAGAYTERIEAVSDMVAALKLTDKIVNEGSPA